MLVWIVSLESHFYFKVDQMNYMKSGSFERV